MQCLLQAMPAAGNPFECTSCCFLAVPLVASPVIATAFSGLHNFCFEANISGSARAVQLSLTGSESAILGGVVFVCDWYHKCIWGNIVVKVACLAQALPFSGIAKYSIAFYRHCLAQALHCFLAGPY